MNKIKRRFVNIQTGKTIKVKINLDELANTPDNHITVEFHEVIDELENNKPVNGTITALQTSYGVKIEGHVETDLILECDRCLENYPYHVNIDIDEEFIKGNLASAETREIELTSEKFVEELRDRKDIDITDLVYQSIILSVPSKKLCTIECKGTEELQQIEKEKPIDPRLEIFRKLSEENKRKK